LPNKVSDISSIGALIYSEWLTNYNSLPVNANCVKEWLKDKQHLNNCACLELEKVQDYYKKNKDVFPELNQFLEEKIEENQRRVEDWEGAIKRTDYSKWSKNIIGF